MEIIDQLRRENEEKWRQQREAWNEGLRQIEARLETILRDSASLLDSDSLAQTGIEDELTMGDLRRIYTALQDLNQRRADDASPVTQ